MQKNREKNKILFMKIWDLILDLSVLKKTIYIFFLFILISCSAPKNITYFQGLENLQEVTTSPKVIATYKPQDIISIVVSASDPETAIPFNTVETSTTKSTELSTNNATSSKLPMYLLDSDGMISFPVIGELKVSGLTSTGVKDLIKDKLKKYIKNPIVSVQLQNFKITILGEVANPGPFTISNEQITLIEAIGLAGDLSITGKRTNITVLRGENNKQTVYKVDLTSKDVFNSPVYYLAQNDVIYIEPNESKAKTSKSNNWPQVLTSIGSLLGIIISVIVLTR